MSTETTPYCYRHPNRETHIRCQRCGRPICPDCMNQAAVGFQCPSCVSEGRKTSRQPTTAYGGRPSRNPARTSQVLIAINVAVWLLINATGGPGSAWLNRLAITPLGRCEAPSGGYYPSVTQQQCASVAQMHWVDGVATGAWWQVVTSVFTHEAVWHIALNMLFLWFLGPQIEAAVGRTRFLAIYLLSGLMGSAVVMWFSPEATSAYGASGANFGMLSALLVIAIKVRADYGQILFWLALNVALTFIGRGFISWQGHLGGLLGGALVALALVAAPRRNRGTWQAGLLGFLAVATILAILARVVVLTAGTAA